MKLRRILVAVAGATILALGLALVVLPGPAFLVIFAGLAVLGIEFAWARRWLRTAREFVKRYTGFVKRNAGFTSGDQVSTTGPPTKEASPIALHPLPCD